MNRNIKNIVCNILEKDNLAREDTNYLIQQTVMQMLPCNAGTAFGQVIQGMKVQGISFEAITRHKRKFLEKNPEYLSKKFENIRRNEEDKYYFEFGRRKYNV